MYYVNRVIVQKDNVTNACALKQNSLVAVDRKT